MDIFAASAAAMRMDAATWARHASPWSVWTRVPVGPALVLALYARAWIGWWCLAPVTALVVWTWLNPRVFRPPATLDSWAARGVLGERLFLDRHARPIPRGHLAAARTTAAIALAGLPPAVYGIVALNPWAAALGAVVMLIGKLWFVDRMVWLHADMTREGAATPGAAD